MKLKIYNGHHDTFYIEVIEPLSLDDLTNVEEMCKLNKNTQTMMHQYSLKVKSDIPAEIGNSDIFAISDYDSEVVSFKGIKKDDSKKRIETLNQRYEIWKKRWTNKSKENFRRQSFIELNKRLMRFIDTENKKYISKYISIYNGTELNKDWIEETLPTQYDKEIHKLYEELSKLESKISDLESKRSDELNDNMLKLCKDENWKDDNNTKMPDILINQLKDMYNKKEAFKNNRIYNNTNQLKGYK